MRSYYVNRPVSYVERVGDREIVAICRDDEACRRVQAIGGKRTWLNTERWEIPFTSENEMAALLDALRDLGFAMAGAVAGWPPAAIFEQLRDKGLLHGTFTEITWGGPKSEILSER